jgi:hypothetical protein
MPVQIVHGGEMCLDQVSGIPKTGLNCGSNGPLFPTGQQSNHKHRIRIPDTIQILENWNLTVISQLAVISRLTEMLPESTCTSLRCEDGHGDTWAADIFTIAE